MSAAATDRLILPEPVLDILRDRHARREKGSVTALKELLAEHEYQPNPSVASFDEAYGGLEFPEGDADDDWDAADDGGWLVGAELCLRKGNHAAPRGGASQRERGLIPIAYSPNDIIYFMDPSGLCWGQDTIEEPEAQPCAKDGATLVTRLILETLLWSPEAKRVEKAGLVGEATAAERGFALIPEASDEFGRWWSGPTGYVAEYETSGDIEAHTVLLTFDRLH